MIGGICTEAVLSGHIAIRTHEYWMSNETLERHKAGTHTLASVAQHYDLETFYSHKANKIKPSDKRVLITSSCEECSTGRNDPSPGHYVRIS